MTYDRKVCFGCQRSRPLAEGQHIVRNKIKRWICNTCLDRKNVSTYASKKRKLQESEEAGDAST